MFLFKNKLKNIFSGFSSTPLFGFLKKEKLYFLCILLSLLIFYINSLNSMILSDEIETYEKLKNLDVQDIDYFFSIYGLIQFILYPNFQYFRIFFIFFHFVNIVFFIFIFKKFINLNVLKIFGVFIVSHSLIAESIVWVSAGYSLTQAFTILTTFFLAIKYKETSKFYFIIFIYLVSLPMVFENKSQALPLILIIFNVLILKDPIKKSTILYTPLFFYNILYFLFQSSKIQDRVAYLNGSTQNAFSNIDFVTPFVSLVRSFELLIFPLNLTFMYLENFSQIQIYFLVAISLLVLFSIGILFIFYRNLATLIIISLLTCLYMFSPIQVSWYLANRYLYFFTFTGVLAFSVFLHYLINKNFKFGVIITITYLFFHSYVLFIKIQDWSQGSRLFEQNVRIVGNHDPRLELYQAQYLTIESKLAEGEKVYKSLVDRNIGEGLNNQFWNFYFLNLMLQGKFDIVNDYLKDFESQNESSKYQELSMATYIVLSRISGEYNLEAKLRHEAHKKNIKQEKIDEIINFYYSYFKSVI